MDTNPNFPSFNRLTEPFLTSTRDRHAQRAWSSDVPIAPQPFNHDAIHGHYNSVTSLAPLGMAPPQLRTNQTYSVAPLEMTAPQRRTYQPFLWQNTANQYKSQELSNNAQSTFHGSSRTGDEPTFRNSIKYSDSDWEPQLPKIKQLYLDEDKSLKETMRIMETTYGFGATEKAYKEKVKKLKWHKNLPAPVAQRMVRIAEARSEAGSKTVFHYGDRPWTVDKAQESLQRAVARGYKVMPDGSPPIESLGLGFLTPPNGLPVVSPLTHQPPTTTFQRAWTPLSAPHTPHQNYPRLVWHGHNRASVEKMREEAQALHRSGRLDEAEKKYREVLAGFENLASPTHEDTMTVAYQLAELYAQLDRMLDADHVLDRLNRMSVEQLGLEHAKTRQHFCRVAELYQRWLRMEDAQMMLYRVFHTKGNTNLEASTEICNLYTSTLPPIRNMLIDARQDRNAIDQELPEISEPRLFNSSEAAEDDEQSGYERAQVRGEPVAVNILLKSVKQYEANPKEMGECLLKALCALVDLLERLGRPDDARDALHRAGQSFWASADANAIENEAFLEACIEVVRLHIKWKRSEAAENILEKLSRIAEAAFGTDDHRMIKFFICIGKMCWMEGDWSDAQCWFEQAYSTSSSVYGLRCKLTMRLEKALDNKSWPYPLSDTDPY